MEQNEGQIKRNQVTEFEPIDEFRMRPGNVAELFCILDQTLDVGVSILDADLNYVYMNQSATQSLKLTKEEFSVGDSMNKVHQLMVDKGVVDQKSLRSNRLSQTELQGLGAEGQTSPISYIPFLDGTVHKLVRKKLDNGFTVSINHDITQFLQKEAMLQKALELGKSGYWVYNFRTKKLELSKSLEAILSPQEIQDMNEHGIYSIVHPDDRDDYKKALLEMQLNGDTINYIGRNKTADKWFHTTGNSERDASGRLIRLRAFVKDITEETKQAQELKKAKDEAISANIAKSEFLANMSHEIRTPMNGVLGMAEVLAESDITDRQRDYVNVITRSSNALLNIINDILDFSKIEAGAFDLELSAFSLRDVIADVTSLLVSTAHEKGLELIVNYPHNSETHFIGDGGRIRQIITNIVGNAIKFTEAGHVLVDIDVRKFTDIRSEIAVNVTDTGIGIKAENLTQIFDKFTQADVSTTRLYGGTGLGLSISKRITELMGGQLVATSEIGKGSTFQINIPLPIDVNAKTTHRNTSKLKGLRVLIVDDNALICTTLSNHLKAMGMRPVYVQDAVQALVSLDHHTTSGKPFDLVMIDHLMPGMNGRDLAIQLKANPNTRDIPIVLLTSSDQQTSHKSLQGSGINAYLLKPVREERLFDCLEDLANTLQPPKIHLTKAPELHPNIPNLVPYSIHGSANNTIKILVAEDFPLNQDVVRLMLSESRFEPVFANDGREAVDLFIQNTGAYAAILMDLSMPIMDGFEAAELIAAHQISTGQPITPIIALTGHALKHDKEKCLEANMHDYLTKPVKKNDLLAALNKWVETSVDFAQTA